MNSWSFSGEVLKHGIKGTKFPKLWMQVLLQSPQGYRIENKFFMDFEFTTDTKTVLGKICSLIKNQLDSSRFFFLHDALVAPIKVNKKKEDDTWEVVEVTGIKGKIKNLTLYPHRTPIINTGVVQGEVKVSKDGKLLVEDRYRNPKDNTWKSRLVPLLVNKQENIKESDKIFAVSSLCGRTESGEDRIHGLVNKIIVTG